MAGNTIDVTDETFEQSVLESEKPVLVDFWAEWCPPCKMLAPIVDEVAGEYAEKLTVAKLNTETSSQTAAKYKVTAIPTLILFKNGEEIERLVGFRDKEGLKSAIHPHV